MIVPEFLRFYPGYTAASVLNEYAVRFFALTNSMYRIQAIETINHVQAIVIGNAEPKDRSNAIDKLEKSSKGIHGIVEEVRTIKGK